ncbi:MAG: hypothetical protein ACOYYS_23820 [Chloroflexota bacterium]
MKRLSPGWLMFIGFILLVLGAVLPLLMVVQVLESTFLLNFIAYTASIAGLLLGMIGVATYFAPRARKKDPRDRDY